MADAGVAAGMTKLAIQTEGTFGRRLLWTNYSLHHKLKPFKITSNKSWVGIYHTYPRFKLQGLMKA